MQTEMNNNTTCPACGMLCDDVNPAKPSCVKSAVFFAQNNMAEPTVAGKAVPLNKAIEKVAALLNQSEKPLIGGLGTDLTGFRAAFELSEKTNATLAHMHAETIWRNTKPLQAVGWQTTTMSEVKNRADVILCVGTDVVKHNTRFFERVVWPKNALFADVEEREVMYLGGEDLDTSPGISPSGKQPKVLPSKMTDLPEIMAALHALVAGKSLSLENVGGIAVNDLAAVAKRLQSAKYAAIVWVVKDLDFPHAELTVQQITQTVATLNATTRAGALAMGGSDGDSTINYAHTWMTGFAVNEKVLPRHDALIWLNSFSPDKPMPETDAPSVIIGNPNLPFTQPPAVFIPVATPGLDAAGAMLRVDGSVMLPVRKVRETDLPTLAEVLTQIGLAL